MTVGELLARAHEEFGDLHRIHDGEFLHSEQAGWVQANTTALQYIAHADGAFAALDPPMIVAIFAALAPHDFSLADSASVLEAFESAEVGGDAPLPLAWATVVDRLKCTERVQRAIRVLRTGGGHDDATVVAMLVCAQALRNECNRKRTKGR